MKGAFSQTYIERDLSPARNQSCNQLSPAARDSGDSHICGHVGAQRIMLWDCADKAADDQLDDPTAADTRQLVYLAQRSNRTKGETPALRYLHCCLCKSLVRG